MASVAPQPRGAADLSAITVEAWITPPDYTRLAPIALKADPAAEPVDGEVALTPIEVPVGSKLLVQIQGLGAAANLSANNASKPMEQLDSETQRAELVLKEGDKIGIAGGGLDVGWPIALQAGPGADRRLAGAARHRARRAALSLWRQGRFRHHRHAPGHHPGQGIAGAAADRPGRRSAPGEGRQLPGPDRASVGRPRGRAARGGARCAGPDRRLGAGRHDPAGAQVLSSGRARHHRAAQAPGAGCRRQRPAGRAPAGAADDASRTPSTTASPPSWRSISRSSASPPTRWRRKSSPTSCS